jgi:hypothetical protein
MTPRLHSSMAPWLQGKHSPHAPFMLLDVVRSIRTSPRRYRSGACLNGLAGRPHDEDKTLGLSCSTEEVSGDLVTEANGGRSRLGFGAADAPLNGLGTDE